MGKSGRHKKLSRQEKSKTHLKGVKTLLKAQNVVEPTLRVKKILIREQLVSAPEGQVSTRRKQTLQEVLSALNHHNTNIKKDALAGLMELVIGSNVLTHNLDKILERIASLTSDLEASVRKENLKVAEAVFQRVEETQIQPFWKLLLTHLKCTLTHLNPSVRYNTLPFLQLLVGHFPHLVSESNRIILPSLLSLISSESTSGSGSTSSTSASNIHKPRLNVQVSSGKLNEVRERLRVFTLIGSCLQLKEQLSTNKNGSHFQQNLTTASFEDAKRTESDGIDGDDSISIFSSNIENSSLEALLSNFQERDVKKEQFLGLYYPMGYDQLPPGLGALNSKDCYRLQFNKLIHQQETESVDILDTSHQTSSSTTAPGEDQNQSFWPTFVQSTLAVLTETWVEAGPSQLDSNSSASTSAVVSKSRRMASASLEPRGAGGGGKANNKNIRKPGKIPESQQEIDFDISSSSSSGSDKTGEKDVIATTPAGTTTTNFNISSGSRGRRESTNLSQNAVESLSCILNVMAHLVFSKKDDQVDSSEVNFGKLNVDHDEFMRLLRKNHGSDLTKYFFSHLPYTPMQDSLRATVNTLNLQLFLIAAQLRLMNAGILDKLEGYLNELVNGEVLDSEQCHLILRILSCTHHSRQRQVSTKFVAFALSESKHSDLICNFLARILRLQNRNPEEIFLIENLDWNIVTTSLMENFEEISKTFLTLLTLISMRRLADVKKHLMNKNVLAKFKGCMETSSPLVLWNECIRLFWYSDALPEFKKSFHSKVPSSVNLN